MASIYEMRIICLRRVKREGDKCVAKKGEEKVQDWMSGCATDKELRQAGMAGVLELRRGKTEKEISFVLLEGPCLPKAVYLFPSRYHNDQIFLNPFKVYF